MTTSNKYDYLNRLTSVSSTGAASGAVPASFNYAYNSANQRTRSTLVDNIERGQTILLTKSGLAKIAVGGVTH